MDCEGVSIPAIEDAADTAFEFDAVLDEPADLSFFFVNDRGDLARKNSRGCLRNVSGVLPRRCEGGGESTLVVAYDATDIPDATLCPCLEGVEFFPNTLSL